MKRMSYRSWLNEEIQTRKRRNLPYSLRAMARDLGITPGALSLVLSGRRHFSAKTLRGIARTLKWSDEKLALALEETKTSHLKSKNTIKRIHLSKEQFSLVDDWHFWAIISLATVSGNQASPDWIAKRLGISKTTAQKSLETLLKLRILDTKDGKMIKPVATEICFVPGDNKISRAFHKKALEKSIRHIKDPSTASERRLEIFRTIKVSQNALNAVEHQMRLFTNSIAKISRESTGEEVYALLVQAFPLTKPN